jgi:hypothetical protein
VLVGYTVNVLTDLMFTWYYADTQNLSENEKINLKMAMKVLHIDVAGKYISINLIFGMYIPMRKIIPIIAPLFLITLFGRNYAESDFWSTYLGD